LNSALGIKEEEVAYVLPFYDIADYYDLKRRCTEIGTEI